MRCVVELGGKDVINVSKVVAVFLTYGFAAVPSPLSLGALASNRIQYSPAGKLSTRMCNRAKQKNRVFIGKLLPVYYCSYCYFRLGWRKMIISNSGFTANPILFRSAAKANPLICSHLNDL